MNFLVAKENLEKIKKPIYSDLYKDVPNDIYESRRRFNWVTLEKCLDISLAFEAVKESMKKGDHIAAT